MQKYNYRGIRRLLNILNLKINYTLYLHRCYLFSAVIYGGSSRKNQIFQCEAGKEF